MKTTLLILALLVHTAHSSNYTRAETVNIFNSWRSLIAKREPLTNMNQLVYNSDLEKVIDAQLALTGGCPDSQMIVANTDSKIDIEIHLNVDLAKKEDTTISKKLAFGVGKSDMGYVETKCMATGEEVHSYAFYTKNKEEIFGDPGSECDPGRKGTSDGLCALEKSYGRKVVSRSIWKDSGFPPIGIFPPPFKNKDYNPITKSREDNIPVFERTREEEEWENWWK